MERLWSAKLIPLGLLSVDSSSKKKPSSSAMLTVPVGQVTYYLLAAPCRLSGNVRIFGELDPEWEVDPRQLTFMDKVGEGEFGVVYKAKYLGTIVAVKVLKNNDAVALGDFRWAGKVVVVARVGGKSGRAVCVCHCLAVHVLP
jgi:hypothetical protein